MLLTKSAYKLIPISFVITALAILAGGCSKKYLEGTKIEDSDETRQVIRVVETYRRAMEARDANMLIALASENYFEKNGDSSAGNNYDHDGLVRFLRSSEFRRITQLRMTIIYKSIVFNEDRNVVTVRYHYTSEFKIPSASVHAGSDADVIYDEGAYDGSYDKEAEEEDPLQTPTPVGPAEDQSEELDDTNSDNDDAEVWHSVSDDNEMILELESTRWYIMKGM
jgi:hypothetical protein